MKFFNIRRASENVKSERQLALKLSDRIMDETREARRKAVSVEKICCSERIYKIEDIQVGLESIRLMSTDEQKKAHNQLRLERIVGLLTVGTGIFGLITTIDASVFGPITVAGGAILGIFIGYKQHLKKTINDAMSEIKKLKAELTKIKKANQETLSSASSQS